MGDTAGQGNAYERLGNAFKRLGNFEEDISCHNKCISIAKEVGDRASEGRAYCQLGCLYLDNLGKYLLISIEIGDRTGQGLAYGNLCFAYM